MADADVRCWSCGIEPAETYEVVVMDHDSAVAAFVRWPPSTDHEHAEHPPTPEGLADAGRKALLNIQAENEHFILEWLNR